ncbi:MAG: hypothetical protein ACO1N7_04135, partial [Sphingobacteriaceae bacterium]
NDSLAKAVDLMSKSNEEFLPVISSGDERTISAVLTYKHVLTAYKIYLQENEETGVNLSLKRQRIKVLIKGRQLISASRINLLTKDS